MRFALYFLVMLFYIFSDSRELKEIAVVIMSFIFCSSLVSVKSLVREFHIKLLDIETSILDKLHEMTMEKIETDFEFKNTFFELKDTLYKIQSSIDDIESPSCGFDTIQNKHKLIDICSSLDEINSKLKEIESNTSNI